MKCTMMKAALGIWILSVVICVGRGHYYFGYARVNDQTGQETAADSSPNSVSLVTAANKEFAFRLYRKLAAHASSQGKNIFLSPVSVSLALAALSVGAREETHRQLFSGLGFSNTLLTQSDVDRVFKILLQRVNKTSNEDISEGTAVFLDNRFKPRPEFLETLKQSYFTEGFNVDFTKSTDSANTINKYVEEKTNGKIDKLVNSLDQSTVMYLISYIYFKGKWVHPFDPRLTWWDMFTVNDYYKVPVQMMNMDKRLYVYYDPMIKTSVLHLPLHNCYSMLLMLPDNMATLENVISPGHITKWLRWMECRAIYVSLPKFSIKTLYSMKDVLTEMGMTDMFGDRADLSGIAEGQELAVSGVVHQAALDVDEVGVTAAAATGVGFVAGSAMYTPILRFDRPFMVIITESNTENILFMGKIINPNI